MERWTIRTSAAADYVRGRGLSLALVILVMAGAALAQASISYTFAFGELRGPLGLDLAKLTELGYLARWSSLSLMAALWLLGKRRGLFLLMIAVNAFATLALLL